MRSPVSIATPNSCPSGSHGRLKALALRSFGLDRMKSLLLNGLVVDYRVLTCDVAELPVLDLGPPAAGFHHRHG